MSWTITLEDEERNTLELLSENLDTTLLKHAKNSVPFLLLKYLDIYGDIVFNRLQMNDLYHFQ